MASGHVSSNFPLLIPLAARWKRLIPTEHDLSNCMPLRKGQNLARFQMGNKYAEATGWISGLAVCIMLQCSLNAFDWCINTCMMITLVNALIRPCWLFTSITFVTCWVAVSCTLRKPISSKRLVLLAFQVQFFSAQVGQTCDRLH